MSRQARDWAWALDRVTPTQKFVILALAERADESGICWPSLRRLSAMTLLARSTVVLALGALEAGGLITRERGGSGRSTIYRICVPGGEGGTPPSRAPAPGPRHAPVYAPAVRAPDRASPPDGPHRPAGGRTLVRQVDTNRHKNRHITVSEPSVCDSDGRDTHTDEQISSGKACRIPPDWQPSERVFAWAAKLGLTRDWVEAQIAEFRLYWGDTGERRRSWDATFINRLQVVQSRQPKDPHHEPEQRLADKDYTTGATRDQDLPDWARGWRERADDTE